MQQLLPLAIRRLLPRAISKPVMQLCSFFKKLCTKVGRLENLNNLESEIAVTLCHLERIFPPSFFDIMVHLTVHLVSEVKIGGLVQARWMYPIERFLSTLKSYVGNKAHPEGSIANGYLAVECLTFCSRYLHGVETRFNRPSRNYDRFFSENETQEEVPTIFPKIGRSFGHEEVVSLGNDVLDKAHHYVLTNCSDVDPFIEQHLTLLKSQYPRKSPHAIQVLHNSTFQSWFAHQIYEGSLNISQQKLKLLKRLARLPNNVAKKFHGFVINGLRFHTSELERKRKTQNSGVMITASTQSYASARDRNPVYSEISYYGVIQEMLELDYNYGNKVVLFKCDWVSDGRGLKHDDLGFTLVNFSQRLSDKEPFIMASQAQQVFYVRDPIDTDWQVVIKTIPRDLYDMGEEEDVDVDTFVQTDGDMLSSHIPNDDDVDWTRTDRNEDLVDAPAEIFVPEWRGISDTEQEEDNDEENSG